MDTCKICGKEWSTLAPRVHPECVDRLEITLNKFRESLAFSDLLEKRQAAEIERLKDKCDGFLAELYPLVIGDDKQNAEAIEIIEQALKG